MSTSPNQALLQGLERAPVGALVASLDLDGEIIWVNTEFTRITGYTVEQIPTVRAWLVAAIPDPLRRRAIHPRWPFADEEGMVHTVQCADGAIKVVQARGSLLDDGQVLVLVHDVTRRQRAEEALRHSEERYALAARAGGVGVWEVWPFQGRIFGDESLAALMHMEPSELSEDLADWLALFPDEDARHMRALLAQVLDTALTEITLEHRARRGDGEERWYALNARVVDPDDRALRIVGTSRDITVWKHAQQALEDSEARYRSLVESSPVGIALHQDGKVVFANQAALRMLRVQGDGVGDSIMDYVHPDHRASVAQRSIDIYEGRVDQLELVEERFVCADGTVVHMEVGGAPAVFQGRPASQVVFVDISARKAAQEALLSLEAKVQQAQRMESLALLAGGVAHDFNNLLMGILGHADLALVQLRPEAKVRQSIEGIVRAAQRAAELSRQMLAYSGRGRFVVEPVRLSEVLRDMDPLVRASVSRKARLHLEVDSEELVLDADLTQLRQLVLNLVNNASEALEGGEGDLSLSLGQVRLQRDELDELWLGEGAKPGLFCRLDVSDTGSGMEPAVLERIFEPFFTTKFTGRGLGLAAVLGIVRGHAGAIQVRSTPGRGTTFSVYLPARPGPRPQVEPEAAAPADDWQGSGRILLVDDEEAVRTVVGLMLEQAGFEVLLARDGHEALALFQQHADHLRGVILDLTMPGMGGDEVLGLLRQINPQVKVLLSSGYNHVEVVERLLGQPHVAFLQKPYAYPELVTALQQMLGVDAKE